MAQAEGKNIPFVGLDHVDVDVLEAFPAVRECELRPLSTSGKDGFLAVHYTTSEFSAVCPFSGLPDVAKVSISYVPDDLIVELKSLKYYLMSYRQVGVYQEHVTRLIASHLADLLQVPVTVETDYNVRGGIDTMCSITVRP